MSLPRPVRQGGLASRGQAGQVPGRFLPHGEFVVIQFADQPPHGYLDLGRPG